MAENKKYNSILISGRKDQTLTYSKYVKDEESGESVKESLDKKVNVTDELTTPQIKDGAITNEKMAAGSVGNTNLQDGSVSNEKLQDGSITNEKLEENSITKDKLKDNTIGVEKLDPELRQTINAATGDYAKKSETVDLSNIRVYEKVLAITPEQQILNQVILFSNFYDENTIEVEIKNATSNMAGFMSIQDKNKLDKIADGANNYSLPLAANGTRGGIQVGYAANGRNYPVQLSGEMAYVNVPWTDTTYDLTPYAKKSEAAKTIDLFYRDGGDIEIALFNFEGLKLDYVTIYVATEFGSGLMTAADKTKLDGISSGATADSAITTEEIDALFA